MTCVVSLCQKWIDDKLPRRWLWQIPVDANVIDKQPKSVSRQQTPLSTLAHKQTEQQATGLFTPLLGILSSCFSSLWKVSHPQQFRTKKEKKKQVSVLLSTAQRLKNFALISVSDRDFMRVTRGDQQWFGERSPSPILHKGPNTLCLGSGPSLDGVQWCQLFK